MVLLVLVYWAVFISNVFLIVIPTQVNFRVICDCLVAYPFLGFQIFD